MQFSTLVSLVFTAIVRAQDNSDATPIANPSAASSMMPMNSAMSMSGSMSGSMSMSSGMPMGSGMSMNSANSMAKGSMSKMASMTMGSDSNVVKSVFGIVAAAAVAAGLSA